MAKILIVEDESIVAWDIKETLEKLGHTVVDLAISGAEAIRSATIDSPDLVLMDIRLEGEMDGISTGDEIYHRLKIPVVYLTAHADEFTLERATKTDPFGYILKPFQSRSLQSTIKVALQRHQAELSAQTAQISLGNTLENIGSGIIINDRQGLVTLADLWERNEDLAAFQLKLISQLQAKTAEYQQSIACIQILDSVLTTVRTAPSESALLASAIQQLCMAIDADYCWITLHDRQGGTARIVCEHINPERQIYPTSKIGREIDLLLYPQFYNHLSEIESWIEPPVEIIPKVYQDLLTIASQLIVCPMIVNPQKSAVGSARQNNWMIGEIGIISTGNLTWASFQSQAIVQTFSHAIQLFRQTHPQ